MPKKSSHQPRFDGWDDGPARQMPRAATAAAPAATVPASVPAGDGAPSLEEGGAADLEDRLVVLVDAHSLIYQVFHALPPMSSPSGLAVGAVHGFVGDVLELLARKCPDYLFCAFDKSDVTFRNELYAAYKAHREPMPDDLRQQIPLIRRALDAMGVAQLECAGFEADDILATVARQVESAGGRCLIVTSDKDCRQLISDRVQLYNLRRDEVFGREQLRDTWGIRPDQVVDFQALVGDPVDNVPGIPLIGPKLAQQLLEQHETLEGVLENADKVSGPKRRKNLQEGREQALLSRRLTRLRTDAPCTVAWEAGRVRRAEPETLAALFEELGFRRLAVRARELLCGDGDSAGQPAGESWEAEYQVVTDASELEALVERLAAAEQIAVDTETTSTNARASRLVGISVAWAPGQAAYIPVRAPAGDPVIDEATAVRLLRPVLEDPALPKVGQNLKFDIVVLRSCGVRLAGVAFDTMVADYLLDPGRRGHTLDDLARRHLHHETIPIKDLIGTGKKQKRMDEVPLEQVGVYAAEDADVPLRLVGMLREALVEQGLDELFETVEMPLVEVLAEMEFNGIRVDRARLAELSERFGQRIARLREEIHALAGREFNIDSPRQLAEILFTELELPVVKRTKTGPSTDVDVLGQLAPVHPLPAKIVEYRQATKLKNTYVDALPVLIHPETGRVHTSFRQDVAATGRLSSSEPNLQNIPIRAEEGREIRSAFRAGPEGWILLAADYSQIELRMLAHFSQDAALLDAYHRDQDVHRRVAAEVNGVAEQAVTPEMRRVAKTINFGIVYGQSPFGLAKTLGISRDEAAEYIAAYFARYPGVQQFMFETLAACRRDGAVATLLGRRRKVQGVRDFSQLEAARRLSLTEPERIAVNTVIQGSAADLIKRAMLRVDARLRREALPARMLLQIHDELVFEVDAAARGALAELVRQEMTEVMTLRVPLKVDVKSGPTWAECEPV